MFQIWPEGPWRGIKLLIVQCFQMHNRMLTWLCFWWYLFYLFCRFLKKCHFICFCSACEYGGGVCVGLQLVILASVYRHNWAIIPLWWNTKLFIVEWLFETCLNMSVVKLPSLMFEMGLRDLEAASNRWYFVGFKNIIASCHGHLSGSLFFMFTHFLKNVYSKRLW